MIYGYILLYRGIVLWTPEDRKSVGTNGGFAGHDDDEFEELLQAQAYMAATGICS